MKRRTRRAQEFAQYVVRITSWESWWSFHTNFGRHREVDAYGHSCTITLRGDVFRPENFSYPHAKITFSGKPGLLAEKGDPTSIGMITARDTLLDGFAFVPSETMVELIALAASGRVQLMHILGTTLQR